MKKVNVEMYFTPIRRGICKMSVFIDSLRFAVIVVIIDLFIEE